MTLHDALSGSRVEHIPRAFYVLVYDETTQLFVERERVALGVQTVLICLERLAEGSPGHSRARRVLDGES